MNMSKILDCDAEGCAYNRNKECHAIAITVGDKEPLCDTFVASTKKAGMKEIGGVGACRVSRCQFNSDLECTADGIHVKFHEDQAVCKTFAESKTFATR